MENIIDLPIQSEKVIDLIKALESAQKASTHVSKDGKGYNYYYSTYENTVEHFVKFYSEHGLSFSHSLLGNIMATTIFHSSGQWIRSYQPIICAKQNDPQAFGSAITYCKRYSLTALAGMSSADDDAASAMPTQPAKQANISQPSPVKTQAKPETHQAHAGITEPQAIRLKVIASKVGWTAEDVNKYIAQLGISDIRQLSWLQYEKICELMEKFPKPLNQEKK